VKSLLAILIAVVLVLALVVPTFAAPPQVTTTVNVGTGTGIGPTVKVKWEQSSLNSNGPTTTTYGNVNPPLAKCGWVEVDYYAVVTSPQPIYGDVSNVFAWVYSPANSPAPYNSLNDPALHHVHPNYKYQVDYTRVPISTPPSSTDITGEVAIFNAVPASALTFGINPSTSGAYTSADILLELNKPGATLWHGRARLTYEQPAGAYIVDVYAAVNGITSTSPGTPYVPAALEAVENTLTYNPVPAIALDFTTLNYGTVTAGVDTWVNGDIAMASPPGTAGVRPNGYPVGSPNGATVENIGNTWASIDIWQDDTGFGQGEVLYDYKLGPGPAVSGLAPNFTSPTGYILPNSLGLSMLDELDFSILVIKAIPGTTAYTGHLRIAADNTPFTSTGPITGLGDPCSPPLPWPPVPIW
jgi:hypothetical protein